MIPISLLPPTNIPQITVQINAENTTAAELEENVVRTLRNQFLQVNRLRDIQSEAENGLATITLDFEYGTSVNLAFIETNEKLDQVISLLPKDLERPRVLKAGVTDIPVFYLSVVPKRGDPLELAEFAQAILRRRMEQLPQIAFVDLSGYAVPEIIIQPNEERWQSLGLQQADLKNILEANNLNLGSVLVQDGQYQYNIRFQSTLRTIESIQDIYFRHQGQLLRLGDLAQVQLHAQTPTGSYLYNQEQALVFAVRKQADAQLFQLKKSFAELLDAFKNEYPNLEFHLSNDQSELLAVSIDNLRTSLLYGACFAILIMFVFFRDWRAPVLIGLAIPIALVLAVLGFYLVGLSINIISLSGLILGVGLMIDNSIIVIENIQQFRKRGHNVTEAGVLGAQEVIRPLISSALTTCSVFVPLIFLSGLAGSLFYDQAISISIALTVALLLAYFVLPTLFRLFTKEKTGEQIVSQNEGPTYDSWFTRSVDVVLRFPWLFLILFVALLGSAYWPLQQMPQQTFPTLSRKAIQLELDWNTNLSFQENEDRTKTMIARFDSATLFTNAFVGTQQFLLNTTEQSSNQTNIVFYYNPEEAFPVQQLQSYLRQNYPEATFEIQALKNIFDEVFGGTQAPLIAHLQQNSSREAASLEQIQTVIDFLEQRGIPIEAPALQEQMAVRINRQQALFYDVSHQQVVQKLQALFADYRLGDLNTSNALIPIYLAGVPEGLFSRIQAATIINQQGNTLPLQLFVELKRVQAYKTIQAGVSGVSINLALPQYDPILVEDLKQYLKEETQLSAYFSGQTFTDQQTIRELTVILLISLLLLYLILAAQFESLVQPFIVMLTVPVSITGGLFLLWWSAQSINLVSIIGMIVMSGIVVNDAILKVDMMNRLRKTQNMRTAIHGAGHRRLKPILMTSITTILALMPILFASGLGAELQRPLAYAVIGGLVIGTLSSLYFIPLVYQLIYGGDWK
ncbi:MAG: efflux RND transporter permease subunit [Saprospiraceae bacterium]